MYEPMVGDLVTSVGGGVISKVEPVDSLWCSCSWDGGRAAALVCVKHLTPLRPDAPGQRVRAFVGGVFAAGVTAEAVSALAAVLRDPPRAPEWLREAMAGPTCQHCGSGIVAGLLRDTCPRGCDLTLRAKEPEPECLGTLPWTYANIDAGAPMPTRASVREPVWTAAGRGVAASHPTREGAIAAWREAVRR